MIWFLKLLFFFLTATVLLPITSLSSLKAGEGTDFVSRQFEMAKKSRPELIIFLRNMPKGADLHNHLDGSTFSENILKSAAAKKLNYNVKTNFFTALPVGQEVISLNQLRNTAHYFEDFRRHFSMRDWTASMGPGRDHFFSIFERIFSSERLEKAMLAEVMWRSQQQNIQYLELISPVVPQSVLKLFQDNLKTFDRKNLESAFDQIKHLVARPDIKAQFSGRLDEWEDFAFKKLQSSSEHTNAPTIKVRYIPYLIRLGRLRDFFISAATAFAAVNADQRVVAINIVAPEDLPDANDLFEDHMAILDFLWTRMGQPLVTLHAGELTFQDATLKTMQNRIRRSLDKGHARRIGHGISIAWEKDVHGLLKQMKTSKTLVEICLTSNEVILGISGRDHPFELYRKAGVPLSLNTDDEGISRSPLTLEFVKAVERYDLDYQDVLELVRNSLEYAFLKGKSLFVNGDYNQIQPEFKGIRTIRWQPSAKADKIMDKHPKLAEQVRLERAIVKFEQTFQD